MTEKHYPTDTRGELDAGADRERHVKPCANRIEHANELEGAIRAATWCSLAGGHVGQCSGPVPRVIASNDFMPKRSK